MTSPARRRPARRSSSRPDAGPPSLDRTFAALAHPARRSILRRLTEGGASATELGEPLAMSQPAVSKHLKVLEQAGLISRGRDAQWRPCALQTAPLREADEWIGGFRKAWESRLDRLENYLRQGPEAPNSEESQHG